MSYTIEFSSEDRANIPFKALLAKSDEGYENAALILAHYIETRECGATNAEVCSLLNQVAAKEDATGLELALAIRLGWEARLDAERYFAIAEKRLGGKLV